MGWPIVVQATEEASSWDEAYGILMGLRSQDGCLGGRLVQQPGGGWRVQAFHDAEGLHPWSWVPDGLRVVCLPPRLAERLGIEVHA